jgi:imidazolonepropionase-like amidohydrolase
MNGERKHSTSNIQCRTSREANASDTGHLGVECSFLIRAVLMFCLLSATASAQTILFTDAVVHTATTNGTIAKGAVLVQSNKISGVWDLAGGSAVRLVVPSDATFINLKGQHLYPGLIAANSSLGLGEIDAVRATQDASDVGEGYTPDVESWIAINPDSELLPVARASGIAYFEAAPLGKIVAGQSALLSMDGWTWEQMLVKKPVALHVFWPETGLNTVPKERFADPSKWKSLEDQDKERRKKLRELDDFLHEARAYAQAKFSATNRTVVPPEKIPAWESMLSYIRGHAPLVIHANEVRQIKSAVNWAATNQLKVVLAGGRDAWMVADLLATNKIPVIYENIFTQPSRDTESYDVQFKAPEVLRRAGVTVIFSTGQGGFGAALARNLPYHAAQAMAFGFPEDEALKSITLYPAQVFGIANRTGSIEVGKDATIFICDGNLFDIRSNVKRMWIAGREINLDNRHTRLYEKYKNRPQP